MKKYIYFVSYFFVSGRTNGYGSIEMTSPVPYTEMAHLNEAREVIQKTAKSDNCVILNYILLRTEDVDD